MNARNRVVLSLSHEEADRIPLFDLAFSTRLAKERIGSDCFFPRSGGLNLKKILLHNKAGREERLESIVSGTKTQIEVYKSFGYDIMPLIPTEFLQPVFGGFGLFGSNVLLDVKIEDLGCDKWKVTGEDGFWSIHGYEEKSDVFVALDDSIRQGGIDELARYIEKLESLSPALNEHTKDALVSIRTAVEHESVRNGDIFLLGHCDICMTGAEAGYAMYLEAFAAEPSLIRRFFAATTEGLMPILRAQLEMGVDGILGANDWCYKTGPVISPAMFKGLMVPHLKRIVDETHKYGKPYVKHLDGNVMPILDMLIDDVGIDAYHSIEPTANMDIFRLKQEYGKRISLWGNIDSGELLINGSPDEVREYCLKLIRCCGPGGGYVMATSNAIQDAVPMENLMMMINTCKESGTYLQ